MLRILATQVSLSNTVGTLLALIGHLELRSVLIIVNNSN